MAYHMHTIFNLAPRADIAAFTAAFKRFADTLRETGLVVDVGPIGRRRNDPWLDTDKERNHEFLVTLSFANRSQANEAVNRILARQEPLFAQHHAAYDLVADPIFFCFEDI